MSQVRINVRSIANSAAVREEVRNGRNLMIVPSATLPDNVVMNGILYPAEEIESAYKTLERTPAPFGHPTINGKFVSSLDPEGINIGYIGAWNENARREGGRVLLDKVIDVEIANQSEKGRRVLEAIKNSKPIHTSTGLLANLENSEGEGYTRIARGILFDHDAILLDEEGAATPDQGVGMLVNGQQVEVINSAIAWAEQDLEWAVESAVSALDRRERAGMVDSIKAVLIEAFSALRKPQVNQKEEEMDLDKKVADLEAKVDQMSTAVAGFGDVVANAIAAALKPITDEREAALANAKALEDAEKAKLVNSVVKSNLLTEAVANSLTLEALRELGAKAAPKGAAALNTAAPVVNENADEWAGYSLNASMEGK